MKEAVNFLLVRDGQYLLEWREDGVFSPGYWAVPGGKPESGETIWEAFCRELEEELGVTTRVYLPMHSVESGSWEIYPFLVTSWDGIVPRQTDAGDLLRWFSFSAPAPQLIWPVALKILNAARREMFPNSRIREEAVNLSV